MSNATTTVRSPSWVRPVWSLWKREVLRFLRQRSRIVGALGTPIVFWLLIGSGLRESFSAPGIDPAAESVNYLEYFFPGTMVMIVLFTAIFATISVIEDRREGFLQGVIASPAPRSAIVVGKVLGSTTLAFVQAMLFLLLAIPTGLQLSAASFLVVGGIVLLVSVGLSALGLLIAWPMDSTQGFHAVMNLFLMPMWLLSGALFPSSGASPWVSWIMALNPLSYGLAALRRGLYPDGGGATETVPSMALSIGVTAVFGVVMVVLASRAVHRRA